MKSLAIDYWLENTERIYEEDLHVSTPVIEAYEAGFLKCKELILAMEPNPDRKWFEQLVSDIKLIGEKEEGEQNVD